MKSIQDKDNSWKKINKIILRVDSMDILFNRHP